MTKGRRTRTRKPRFLSLRRQLARPSSPEPAQMAANPHGQLDLFPLHPQDKDEDHDNPSTSFFDPEYRVDDAANLDSLLGTGSTATGVAEEEECVSASTSVNYESRIGLARTALRGRERWVFFRSEDGEEEGEASSGGVDLWGGGAPHGMLSLKLDYEEVLTAWSDKGPLYVEGEGPQVVPQFHHHHHYDLSVFVEVNNNTSCSSSSLWTVPENGDEQRRGGGSREERVMRYREKRRSRLFSKRIRYEVRKLNAEKRPRIKGRFVKRMDEEV